MYNPGHSIFIPKQSQRKHFLSKFSTPQSDVTSRDVTWNVLSAKNKQLTLALLLLLLLVAAALSFD
jgi:hypothetical protein